MDKSLLIIFLLSFSSSNFSMEPSCVTLKDILKLQGVSKQELLNLQSLQKKIIDRLSDKDSSTIQITSLLPKEDVADMRLVCREWAPKDVNWKKQATLDFHA